MKISDAIITFENIINLLDIFSSQPTNPDHRTFDDTGVRLIVRTREGEEIVLRDFDFQVHHFPNGEIDITFFQGY